MKPGNGTEDLVLTGEQRKYLNDQKEISENYKRQIRRRIRNRFQKCLKDIHLIQSAIERGDLFTTDDRRQIFQSPSKGRSTNQASSLLKLAYGGLIDLDHERETIENIFEENIRKVEVRRDKEEPVRDVTVSLDIERQRYDLQELEYRFSKLVGERDIEKDEQVEPLSDTELMALFRNGRIDGEQLEQYTDPEIVEV